MKGDRVLKSELVKEYHNIFIMVHRFGHFQYSDIGLNDVRSVASVPDFVINFEQGLDRRPGVDPDCVVEFVQSAFRF